MILQSLQFILFCVRKMILNQIVVRISKRLFLLITLYTSLTSRTWWTYVDFDCGITSFPETPTKIRRINREWNYISQILWETPMHSQQPIKIPVLLMSSIALRIFLNPYNLWDMVPAALFHSGHTNETYSMFNQYPQPTTQQPRADSYPVFSSLRTMNSKRKGMRVSFAFFKTNYLPDGRMNRNSC